MDINVKGSGIEYVCPYGYVWYPGIKDENRIMAIRQKSFLSPVDAEEQVRLRAIKPFRRSGMM